MLSSHLIRCLRVVTFPQWVTSSSLDMFTLLIADLLSVFLSFFFFDLLSKMGFYEIISLYVCTNNDCYVCPLAAVRLLSLFFLFFFFFLHYKYWSKINCTVI